MRTEFRADLREINQLLVVMATAVRAALTRATTALLTADADEAEQVISGDVEIDSLYRLVEEKVFELLARQAPVASDLRLVIAALHIAADLERMGDLAEHVGRTALRRHPAVAVPSELTAVFTEMGEVADQIGDRITVALSDLDVAVAAGLERDDDRMDALHRQLFEVVLGPQWARSAEAAVDTALLGRFYERFADHAVNAGRHVVFLVTGENTLPVS